MEVMKNSLRKNSGLVATVLFSIVAFIGIFSFVVPLHIHEVGGTHGWLTGSTLKFVNYWLEDGAAELNFTNYEHPNSIEFQSLDERDAYLSYPTGETFFVYMAAKLLGKEQITVAFLHKFQLICFLVEMILMAVFVYCFLRRTVKYKKPVKTVLMAVLTGVLWVLLPTCSYYLTNIYYADQCVILWVMSLILVEYLFRTGEAKWKLPLKIIRALILYSGILIDYYFWILAFFIFCAEILDVVMRYKKGKRKKRLLNIVGWFGVPVTLAVATFFLQVTRTSGWMSVFVYNFNNRVSGFHDSFGWIVENLFSNFAQAFTLNDGMGYYLLIIMIVAGVSGLVMLLKRKRLSALITNPGVSIITCGSVAAIIQVLFLKQHSAAHEFSMTKLGWMVAMLPIIITLIMVWKVQLKHRIRIDIFRAYTVGLLIVLLATGVPISTTGFIDSRFVAEDYSFEETIREHTVYNDVLFSYSEEIQGNPPLPLAASHKLIYKVKDTKEIEKKMSGLPEEAVGVLVVNNDTELDESSLQQQKCLTEKGELRWSDSYHALVNLKEIKDCKK